MQTFAMPTVHVKIVSAYARKAGLPLSVAATMLRLLSLRPGLRFALPRLAMLALKVAK